MQFLLQIALVFMQALNHLVESLHLALKSLDCLQERILDLLEPLVVIGVIIIVVSVVVIIMERESPE